MVVSVPIEVLDRIISMLEETQRLVPGDPTREFGWAIKQLTSRASRARKAEDKPDED
jgi:hypothetical protein